MPNHLADQTSPHLLQHADDPVDWYPWGEEAWKRAVAEAKPVFLSIGYASCHWCHVMQRESFADPEVAALLNGHFISIKVDREERPDLDGLYLESLQTLMGAAGWPMSLFLTPDRQLFFGGTYYPPSPRGELPSFQQVLESVADEWRYRRRELEGQAAELIRQMRDRATFSADGQPLSVELLNQGIAGVISAADLSYGGFGEPPKFPQPWLVELMLRAAARGPGGGHGIADRTLRRMARGGIYDQVGGGFHRYAVDGAWAVPHFEKMLYDNALIARLYTHAWQARHDPLFKRIATETLDYLVSTLSAPGGGFYSAEDSDDASGAEGTYWLWTYDEFAQLAPEAVPFFGVTPEGNFEGRNVLTAAGDEPPAQARARLAEARARRARPAIDTTVLTGWNGLAIAALADAGAAFGRPDYLKAAEEVASVLAGQLSGDGSVPHAVPPSPSGAGLAEDYAYLADGLFALWEATLDARWLEVCEQVARRMVTLFCDSERGGLFSTASPGAGGDQSPFRRKDMIDGVTPSPNGVASLLLQRLGVLLGDEELSAAGRGILEAARAGMQAVPQESGSLLGALDFLVSGPREIAIVGEDGPAKTALLREVFGRYLPNRVLAGGAASSPLLEGRGPAGGRPAAYVFERNGRAGSQAVCRRPTSDPVELARQLRGAGLPSPEQLSRAADMARSTLHRMSLLDQLDNPLWIDPLREQGFFRTPPGSIEEYVPGASGSPPWPDSKYLARMAGVDPFAVHRVAMAIPDTDNPLVHEDLADTALALPPDLAADFARRAGTWLRASVNNTGLPKKLGSLLSHLAKAGHGVEALELARALLELHAEAGAFRGAAAEEGLVPPPQPQPRYGPWDYDEVLKENMPDVVRAAGLPAVELLASVLEQALELSGEGLELAGPPADGSYLWRPNIGEDPRNLDRTVRDSLVSALRDAAELVARENPGVLGDLVATLDGRNWSIFRRLSLHLLWAFPEDAPGLVSAALSDRRLLDDPHTSREWLLLARQQYEGLDEAGRAQLLAWVQEGPDLSRWDGVPERWAADRDDEQAAATYRRWWSASRSAFLEAAGAAVAGAAADDEDADDEDADDEDGDDEDGDDAAFAFVPSGPPVDLATPKQAEWLRTAPIGDVVAFAQRFRP
ncbi:MAG TPA: thioredoxin domain-containing protein, partial [Actinomycetota bacterium]|nr:thioredoxin domain-containing protein [Actinomycetota bacterium]